MKSIRTIIFLWLLLFIQAAYSQTMTLQQCKDAAIENNLQLQMKQEQISQSTSLKKAAFTQYLPSLGFTASYIRMNKPFQLLENDMVIPVVPSDFYDPSTGTINSDLFHNPALMPLAFVMNPETGYPMGDVNGNPVFQQYAWLPADQLTFGQKNNYFMNLGLIQPVFMGGKIRQMNVMAEIAVNISEMQLTMEQEQLLIEIEELYWSQITLNEQLQLAQSSRDLLQTLKAEVESYWTEGIVMNNDYLKVELKIDEVELDLFKLENGIRLTRKALCQKMGFPLDEYFTPSDTIIPADFFAAQPEDLIRSATTNRTELKLLEQSVMLSGAGVKMMRSRFLPDIGFTANYSYINPNPYAGFSETFGGDYNLGIMLNVPIFHFGERQHTMSAARSQYRVLQLQLENARQMITIQTEMAMNELNETWKAVEMNKKSYNLTEKNLNIMADQWDEGMCKLSEFLEAQVLWQKAASKYIESKAEYRKKIMNIQKIAAIEK